MTLPLYFDFAAAAPPLPEAVDFYRERLLEDFYNQEAIHAGAHRLRQRFSEAEVQLSSALFPGLPPRRVVWENSATMLFGLLAESPVTAGKRVVTSNLEHPALTAALERSAAEVVRWKADASGAVQIPPEPAAEGEFAAAFFHQVQSEIGVIQDTGRLFAAAPGAVRVVDAVQAAGKLELDPDAAVTVVSGAKFGSPCGAAVLISPEWDGADDLAAFADDWRRRWYRGGRIPFAVAATLAHTAMLRRQRMTGDLLRARQANRELSDGIAALGLRRTVPADAASPYILHITLPEEPGAVVVRMLSEEGILAASGSACAAESPDPSPALLALGVKRRRAYNGLRLSFGGDISENEVQKVLAALKKVLKNF